MSRLDEALARLERAVARLEAVRVSAAADKAASRAADPEPKAAMRLLQPVTDGMVATGDEGPAGFGAGAEGRGIE